MDVTLRRATVGASASLVAYTGLGVALFVSATYGPGPSSWSAQELRAWFVAHPVGASFRLLSTAALVIVLYLASSTIVLWLGTLAAATQRPKLARVVRSLASPFGKRLLAASLGIGLSAAVAQSAHAGEPGVAIMRPLDPTPAPSPQPTAATAGDGQATGVTEAAATWTVQPGDHLWGLAQRALAGGGESSPTDAEIAAYVDAVVELNRSRLVVPNEPDLIFPGQVFERPPLP
jgi:hypothetical protein